MRLDLGKTPGADRRAFGEALVKRFRGVLSASFPEAQGYRHSAEAAKNPPAGDGFSCLRVNRGLTWGLRVSVRLEKEPAGALKIVVREALPLMEKLKSAVLVLAAVAAVGIGIVSFGAGIMEGRAASLGVRKGMALAAILFGGLSGLATGVGGLLLLGPVHLLCRFRLREDVRGISDRLREEVRAEAASLKGEVPLKSLGSVSGWLFLGAAACGGWLVHSVLKAKAATTSPFDALWILSGVMSGLILLIFLAGHLSEEYGFND